MKILVKDLKPAMMGIYKITFPNNKIYIGKSVDIKRRMSEHNSPSDNQTPCDQAIKIMGKVQEIEILEFINNPNMLDQQEIYWIKIYDATNPSVGYNISVGGHGGTAGVGSGQAKYTEQEVYDIRKRRFIGERKKDVYKDYQQHPFSSFEHIWLGHGYPGVGTEFLIPAGSKSRQEYSSEANSGVKNGRAKCSIEQVVQIRELYNKGTTIAEISKQFQHISKSTIRRIALRETYTNI